jgi:hypothetical protein
VVILICGKDISSGEKKIRKIAKIKLEKFKIRILLNMQNLNIANPDFNCAGELPDHYKSAYFLLFGRNGRKKSMGSRLEL